jgi:hypothetical protein
MNPWISFGRSFCSINAALLRIGKVLYQGLMVLGIETFEPMQGRASNPVGVT